MQGIHPETGAVQFPLITAKLSAKEIATLKEGFPRPGFVEEIDSLDAQAKEFASELSGKGAALPSQAWRLITSARPEAVLAVAFASKSAAIQAKFKSFFTEWPQARQKMPYTLMQEMRIVPELPGYDELLEKLFFELMDGKLATPEEMKAFLEPYSPPAPPPPVSMRRARAAKKEPRVSKARAKKAAIAEEADVPAVQAEAEPDKLADVPVPAAKSLLAKAAPAKVAEVKAAAVKASARKAVHAEKAAPAKVVAKTAAPPAKKISVTKVAAPAKKVVATKSVPAKKVAAKKVVPAKKSEARKSPAKIPAVKAKKR